ncbi:MAG: hypothetical protein ACT4PV_11045 [Planctomycetaceae bacterium]
MDDAGEHLRCVHLLHGSGPRGGSEPSLLCCCPSGMIHMHDCPVSQGRACAHFAERSEPPRALNRTEMDAFHGRLSEDYLTHPYFARLRTLVPGAPGPTARHDALRERYGVLEDGGREEPGEFPDDASYETERDRLREIRKAHEAARAEERVKLDSAERARRGIKTVVERAKETVAEQGNVASSYLDDIALPEREAASGQPPRERRRRGRRRRGGGPSGPRGAGAGGGAPP